MRDLVAVRDMLSANCMPDADYPKNYVHTLHFDTYDFQSYHEKLAGECLKSKLRLRWYSNGPDAIVPKSAYLEHKKKNNNLGIKDRERISLDGKLRENIFDTALWIQNLGLHRIRLGYSSNKLLTPILVSTYLRHRYYDAVYNCRISLDTNIRVNEVNPLLPKFKRPVTDCIEGILEIKGVSPTPPVYLSRKDLLRRESFSKYERLVTMQSGIGEI